MEFPSQTPANRDPYLWEQAQKRVSFKQHLRSYLLVNGFVWATYLVLVFAFGNHRKGLFPWPLFMTLGWGIGLASHYFSVYWTANGTNPVEREYQRLRESSN